LSRELEEFGKADGGEEAVSGRGVSEGAWIEPVAVSPGGVQISAALPPPSIREKKRDISFLNTVGIE